MGKEIKSGPNSEPVESKVSQTLKRKFVSYCKKNKTSQAQIIRDQLQGLLKGYRVR